MLTKTTIRQLKEQYARLAGESIAIERETGDLNGAALRDKIDEITNRQHKIWQKMEAIRKTVHHVEPGWDHERIRPIRPKRSRLPKGTVSRRVAPILREHQHPLTAGQIADIISEQIANEGHEKVSRSTIYRSVLAYLAKHDGYLFTRHVTQPATWEMNKHRTGAKQKGEAA